MNETAHHLEQDCAETSPKRCPRCSGWIPTNEHPGAYPGALSRLDDETEICSACGTEEAMLAWRGELTDWRANGSEALALTHAEVRDVIDDVEQIGAERDQILHDACRRALRAQGWFSLFMSLRREFGDQPFGKTAVQQRAKQMCDASKAKSASAMVRTLGLITWNLTPREYSFIVSSIAELGGRGPVVGPEVEMPTAICASCYLEAGYAL